NDNKLYYIIKNVLSWDNKPIVKIGVSKALAFLGRKCLDFIDDREHAAFKKSYRIEIVPVNHPQWEFQLHISAENWFVTLKLKTLKRKIWC
ncbi:hypothetical protein RhiirA1_428398, partial [Rhizophagus irregularis]